MPTKRKAEAERLRPARPGEGAQPKGTLKEPSHRIHIPASVYQRLHAMALRSEMSIGLLIAERFPENEAK